MPGLATAQTAGGTPLLVDSYPGTVTRDYCGESAGLGDIDGDNYCDFVVGCSGTDPNGVPEAGSVFAISGRTGKVLWSFHGTGIDDALGKVISAGRDVDGDGLVDVVLGVQNVDLGGFADVGRVHILSGATGAELYVFEGENEGDLFGRTAHLIDDVDDDGLPDLLVSAPGTTVSEVFEAGSVMLYSLTNGLLWRVDGPDAEYRLGRSTAPGGDLNGDGFEDVLIGARFADPGGLHSAGTVMVLSGLDGSAIYQVDGEVEELGMGRTVASVGDLDGDTVPDFLAGAPGKNSLDRPGEAYLFSGASGDRIASFVGDQIRDQFGWKVARAGDLDQDGLGDFIITAPRHNRGNTFKVGKVYVYSGRTFETLFTLLGENAEDRIGWFADALGDVDGDGAPEFGVGTPWVSPDDVYLAGSVDIVGYRPFVQDDAMVGGGWEQLERFQGAAAGDGLGSAVAAVDDLDGDGLDEWLVGAGGADPGARLDAGLARVHSGADGSVLFTFEGLEAGDELGRAVCDAGDVNFDGTPDVAVAARLADPGGRIDAGTVTVYSGLDGAVLHTFEGEAAGDFFGRSVCSAGDVDGDGHDDLLVGASRASPGGVGEAGTAYVFSGFDGAEIYRFEGLQPGGSLGLRVAAVGDLDGDTVGELLVGAALEQPNGWVNAGSAYLLSGATGIELHRFDAEAPGDWFGYSLTGLGDANGDGVPDLAIGAYKAGAGGAEAGSVYAFSGLDYSLLDRADGPAPGVWFGYSIDDAGDADGDGLADLLVSSPLASDGSGQGAVSLYSVARQSTLYRLAGPSGNERFGWSVAALDTDGAREDRHALVGAPFAAPFGEADTGRAYVHAFRPFLKATVGRPWRSQETTLTFHIQFPPSEAGANYALLLSTAGTGPTELWGSQVPLTDDALLQNTQLGYLPTPFLDPGFGPLDEQASASVRLRMRYAWMPGGRPFRAWAAAVSWQTTNSVRLSSVAVPVTVPR